MKLPPRKPMAVRATHIATRPELVDGVWITIKERRPVTVLAVAGIWSMVRRPHCVPYVCRTKEIEIP